MTETLTIYPGEAGEQTFAPQRSLPDGRVRIDVDTTLLEPTLLTIRHSTARGGSGNPKSAVVDRHLVQCSRTIRDTNTGEELTATVNLTFIVPRNAAFSTGDILALQTIIIQMMGGAPNIQLNVLRGES